MDLLILESFVGLCYNSGYGYELCVSSCVGIDFKHFFNSFMKEFPRKIFMIYSCHTTFGI